MLQYFTLAMFMDPIDLRLRTNTLRPSFSIKFRGPRSYNTQGFPGWKPLSWGIWKLSSRSNVNIIRSFLQPPISLSVWTRSNPSTMTLLTLKKVSVFCQTLEITSREARGVRGEAIVLISSILLHIWNDIVKCIMNHFKGLSIFYEK